MTLSCHVEVFCMNDLFEANMLLRCKIKSLKAIIKEYESGERYLKLQADHHRVYAGYVKENKALKKELARAHAQVVDVREMWSEECYQVWDECQAELRQKNETIRRLEDRIWKTEMECDEKIASISEKYEGQLYEKDCVIRELKNRLAHAEALLGQDGSNTGLPTSKTPPDRKKRIPNARTKTGRKKGGQPGHEKHELEKPDETEITGIIEHDSTEDGFFCPECNGDSFIPTGECEIKYEYDVEIVVKKIKHVFYYYECLDCGTVFSLKYPIHLRGDVGYGSTLQALALTLTNNVNAAMNKNAMFLAGITLGELTPCEGYIAKLQKRAAKGLVQFYQDLRMVLVTRRILYWDDTVIMIMTKRACFRFYGDEHAAYYTAHATKGWEGINEDGILELLTSDTWVMHDHNTINYNKKFSFKNIECNQHCERDLQKNTDNTQHEWSSKAKTLIGKTIKERDKAIGEGFTSFSRDYIETFDVELNGYLSDGWKENEKEAKNYGAQDERALLRRLEKYHDNYFAWMKDFTLPTTNNLSERGLRGVKSHEKISGQFESVEAARYHAIIKTYTETCRRNGINEFSALKRLCAGNPYTVEEIFSKSPPQ